MAIKLVFSLYDASADTHHLPFHAMTVASAIRSFTDAVLEPTTGILRHPEDYFLKHLGSFDDVLGIFYPTEADHPIVVCTATSVVSSRAVTVEPAEVAGSV